ncbi:MAG: hypothetical protein JST47_06715 [Bacteroidetes bacterium]|nr:hypothetical protein [Bacteroidota bacterium]MBS1974275.1 hypothetical protein [Bacteroidota bacterium]
MLLTILYAAGVVFRPVGVVPLPGPHTGASMQVSLWAGVLVRCFANKKALGYSMAQVPCPHCPPCILAPDWGDVAGKKR